MTFTMWEEFLSVEGLQFKDIVPQQPIILLARPKVNSYHSKHIIFEKKLAITCSYHTCL